MTMTMPVEADEDWISAVKAVAIPLYASFHGFWFIWESLGSDG
jgi:hypothetical protein